MPFFAEAQGTNASHGTFIDVGRDIVTNNNYITQLPEAREVLATLKPVDRSGNYVRTCTEGTRASVFQEIGNWLENMQAPNILWVSGGPGAGKSAIAASLVSMLADEGRLGASLFFRRGDAALSDPAPVWRTIASDLTRFYSAVAYSLVNDIKRGRVDPNMANIESHFNYMIKEALTMEKAWERNGNALKANEDALKKNQDVLKKNRDALKTNQDACEWDKGASMENDKFIKDIEALTKELDILTREHRTLAEERETLSKHRVELTKLRFVVVLDALDECGWEPSQSDQRRTFVDSLTRWSSLSPRFKLIVTGRDERVPRSFRDACKRVDLLTGRLATPEVYRDIAHFFRTGFAAISADYPTLSSWPGEPTIQRLTDRAAGHFLWAETVVRITGNETDTPDEQLRLVLDGDLGKEGSTIDDLYRWNLTASSLNSNSRTLDAFHATVGTIVLAKVPLPRDDLHHFLGTAVSETQIDLILKKLSSVISITETDKKLHIFHLSFAEFLCDRTRCSEPFTINPSTHSQNLALACLRLMKVGLNFNICDLEASRIRSYGASTSTVGVEKLFSSRTFEDVPFRCVVYSCHFWAEHLWDTPYDEFICRALLDEVQSFVQFRLIYWLEIIDLLQEQPISFSALRLVAQWIGTSDEELLAFAQNAHRLINDFFNVTSRTCMSRSAEIQEIIASLNPVNRSCHDVPDGCMEGTRQGLLQDIDLWLEDSQAPNIFWIGGSSGAGKSAIASSLVAMLAQRRRLGASFFIRRNDVTLSDPAIICRTVSFDLAGFHPVVANHFIGKAKEGKVDPERADIESSIPFMTEDRLTAEKALKPYEDALKRIEDALNTIQDVLAKGEEHLRQRGQINQVASKEADFTATTDLMLKLMQVLREGKGWRKFREELLKAPLPVVVLDALDECSWEPSQSDQRRTFHFGFCIMLSGIKLISKDNIKSL